MCGVQKVLLDAAFQFEYFIYEMVMKFNIAIHFIGFLFSIPM